MYVLAIVLAGSLGMLGARQIARPVVRLKEAAFEVAKGNLGLRVSPEGSKEVVELTRAFNFMSRRLAQDQREIAAKNTEIQAFNEELQQRVEDRTKALEQSQLRLVESSRMAAVAQMGAGLAHELNNPIAGILGMAQVAQLKGGADADTLAMIEEQAQRCRSILATLSRFTSGERGEKTRTDLAVLCSNVVELSTGIFSDAGVRLVNEVEGPLPLPLDSAFFGQALAQLLKSLRAELEPGGSVCLTCESDPQEIRLKVSLEGDLRPRGDDWLATGMGFWVARYAVQEHGGRLDELEGASRAVLITLPRGQG
jgi:signal transduction histidine kinase